MTTHIGHSVRLEQGNTVSRFCICMMVVTALLAFVRPSTAQPVRASQLSDLSGMVWIGGDRFLAVHDAKTFGEFTDPRVSILRLPQNLEGVLFVDVPVRFRGLPSNDLESVAWIPGMNSVLMAESGDDLDRRRFQRIFKAEVNGSNVKVVKVVRWPQPVMNVEGTAVARVAEDHYVFLYAERAQNQDSTQLWWADFDPEPVTFGEFQSVTFHSPDTVAYNRPLVAIDVDSAGRIYIASAFDAEAAGLPDPDNGPFASAVYRIGTVQEDGDTSSVELVPPVPLATLDGFKVESVAVRETDDDVEIFVGLDDENYGGTLRKLPPVP